jgi:hypothetical protein
MPGHIFARLGMWQQDIDSNEASVRASELAETNHQAGVAHELHAYDFLNYAYLQQADDANAMRLLDLTEPTAAHLRSLPDIANDGMACYITYVEVEFPSIDHREMHDWKAVLAIPGPQNATAAPNIFRAWAQAIAAGPFATPRRPIELLPPLRSLPMQQQRATVHSVGDRLGPRHR